jgi:two-component system NtrC family sensor kinase
MPSQPTARARAEALGRLFEAVHEGVYIGLIGPRHNETLAANPYLRLIFGYPAEESDASLRPFDPDRFTDEGARQVLVDRLAREGVVTDYLLRLRRADGAAIWIELTAHAEPADGGMLRLDALVRDVSDRKRLEDQSRDLYHQLLQAEKMAALGTTISGVAHELNNPLATILTWAERLAERDLDPQSRRGLETILHEAERAARIVRNLLTFARKRHTTRTMVDVNQVVRETLALRSYEQRVTNITVIDALAAGTPQIFADPHQIQQVLLNLVINAEQAMLAANGRGTLVVRTWQDFERESIVLEVNDDGPGVSDEVKLKIFDPFFTTKEVGKGTGLGLTVAYAIVQEHGGRMWLESAPGAGASYYLELPVSGKLKTGGPPPPGQAAGADSGAGRPSAPDAQADRAAGAAAPGRAQKPAGRGLPAEMPPGAGVPGSAFGQSAPTARLDSAAILIVEDETALASAMVEAFTDAGYLVDRAGDGEEALACLEDGRYDLIISDLKMPRMDGIQLFTALRDLHPEMLSRIVFVTGDVIGSDAERFLGESRCRWLAKPFRLNELLRIARETLATG